MSFVQGRPSLYSNFVLVHITLLAQFASEKMANTKACFNTNNELLPKILISGIICSVHERDTIKHNSAFIQGFKVHVLSLALSFCVCLCICACFTARKECAQPWHTVWNTSFFISLFIVQSPGGEISDRSGMRCRVGLGCRPKSPMHRNGIKMKKKSMTIAAFKLQHTNVFTDLRCTITDINFFSFSSTGSMKKGRAEHHHNCDVVKNIFYVLIPISTQISAQVVATRVETFYVYFFIPRLNLARGFFFTSPPQQNKGFRAPLYCSGLAAEWELWATLL